MRPPVVTAKSPFALRYAWVGLVDFTNDGLSERFRHYDSVVVVDDEALGVY